MFHVGENANSDTFHIFNQQLHNAQFPCQRCRHGHICVCWRPRKRFHLFVCLSPTQLFSVFSCVFITTPCDVCFLQSLFLSIYQLLTPFYAAVGLCFYFLTVLSFIFHGILCVGVVLMSLSNCIFFEMVFIFLFVAKHAPLCDVMMSGGYALSAHYLS